MRTAPHETLGRTKIVSGNVTLLGINKKGVGFICYKSSTGLYVVRWTFPVKQVIDAVASLHAATAGFAVVAADWGSAAITVRTFNTAFALTDIEFGFTATVIPR